jgi:ribonucleotide reductase alpha subunit
MTRLSVISGSMAEGRRGSHGDPIKTRDHIKARLDAIDSAVSRQIATGIVLMNHHPRGTGENQG